MLDDGHPGDFQAASREFVDGIGWWMLDGWMLDGNNQHWWLPSTVFVLQTITNRSPVITARGGGLSPSQEHPPPQ